MRTLPEDTPAVRKEFVGLKNFFEEIDKMEKKKKAEKRAERARATPSPTPSRN
jgi:hypothetical protein